MTDPIDYKCRCGNPGKVNVGDVKEPVYLCNCCFRREHGWDEWWLKQECPRDEDYERSLNADTNNTKM